MIGGTTGVTAALPTTLRTYLIVCILAFTALLAMPHAAQAQLAVKQADIDFGTSQAPVGGTGTNRIGTNGSISYAAGYSGPATGTAGRILINGTVGRRTQVSCETSKTARNVGGTGGNLDETVNPIYIVLGTANAGAPGTGFQCNGSYVIDTSLPSSSSARTLLIGADMAVNSVRNGGSYAFSNAPGGQLSVTIRQSGGGPPSTITINVDLTASFQHPITLTKQSDMDFGVVEKPAAVVASDRADMGTNGSITYAGNFNGSGTGTAGSVIISGVTNGTTLEVYCDRNITLRNTSGTSRIRVRNIEVAAEDARGAFGTGSACNNLTGAAALSFTYQATTRDQIYFGGRLDGSTASGSINGFFSTANPSGNPLDVTVVIP